jgi:hypothetical protein
VLMTMNLEEENAKAHKLWYKPLAWLGVIRPLAQGEDWPLPLCQTFFTTTIREDSYPVMTAKGALYKGSRSSHGD